MNSLVRNYYNNINATTSCFDNYDWIHFIINTIFVDFLLQLLRRNPLSQCIIPREVLICLWNTWQVLMCLVVNKVNLILLHLKHID